MYGGWLSWGWLLFAACGLAFALHEANAKPQAAEIMGNAPLRANGGGKASLDCAPDVEANYRMVSRTANAVAAVQWRPGSSQYNKSFGGPHPGDQGTLSSRHRLTRLDASARAFPPRLAGRD